VAERGWIILSSEPSPSRQERLERDLAADRQRRLERFAKGGSGNAGSRLRRFVRATAGDNERTRGPARAPVAVEIGGVERHIGGGDAARLAVGEVEKSRRPSFTDVVFGPVSYPDGTRRRS
jgi:hypothetical protein